MMHPIVTSAFRDELIKIGDAKGSAFRKVVSVLSKDVPGTPRLMMKHRTLTQRAALAKTVEKEKGHFLEELVSATKGTPSPTMKRLKS